MGHSTIFSHNPQLRYSLTLCEEEKKFIEKRQECVFEKMKAMLGEDAPLSAQEVRAVPFVSWADPDTHKPRR